MIKSNIAGWDIPALLLNDDSLLHLSQLQQSSENNCIPFPQGTLTLCYLKDIHYFLSWILFI